MKEQLEFKLPEYIEEELNEYARDLKEGKLRSAKWMNIRTLLRVAMLNNKLTYEQIKIIEEKYGNVRWNGTIKSRQIGVFSI